jgi:alpha-tubulin suppressor-like RCC1 family protein
MEVELRTNPNFLQLDKKLQLFFKTKVSVRRLIEIEIIYISAGEAHCGAVDTNGSVYLWGNNAHGECG